MNYATDRLDRASRNREGIEGLRRDYHEALAKCNHSMLGRTLCALGWNRHAVYHFSKACDRQADPESIGDYAQMVELAGWPEVGVIALITYCQCQCSGASTSLGTKEIHTTNRIIFRGDEKDTSWFMQHEPPGDCGCGDSECGASVCSYPEVLRLHISEVLHAIDVFLQQQQQEEETETMWSAHEIHRRSMLLLSQERLLSWAELIPYQLRFWEADGYLTPVLRLLLVKLLYLTIPQLACAAVAVLKAKAIDDTNQRLLVKEYKSHAAFYTFILKLVLGDRRVKPARRHTVPYYHVPIWDLLHGLDQRSDYFYGSSKVSLPRNYHDPAGSRQVALGKQWLDMLVQITSRPREGDNAALFPLTWTPLLASACSMPHLFIVGDSHVLSLAWQVVQLPFPAESDVLLRPGQESCDTDANHRFVRFTVVPVVVTGLKAWHCRKETRFFTRTRLLTTLRRLPPQCKTIVFSAGEIDCREGLGGPRLVGYQAQCLDVIPSTVNEYVMALEELLADFPTLQQILVLPVAPHASQSTSRLSGQVSRRETMREWNYQLGSRLKQLASPGLFFVDYVDDIIDDGADDAYVLRKDFAADSTHMNAAFVKHFERAIVDSGCSMSLLLP